MEELIQGFADRINVIETGIAEFLKSFLEQYRVTLETIASLPAFGGNEIRTS